MLVLGTGIAAESRVRHHGFYGETQLKQVETGKK